MHPNLDTGARIMGVHYAGAQVHCASATELGWRTKLDASACLTCGKPQTRNVLARRQLAAAVTRGVRIVRLDAQAWRSRRGTVQCAFAHQPGLPRLPQHGKRARHKGRGGTCCNAAHAAVDPLVSSKRPCMPDYWELTKNTCNSMNVA